MTINSYPWDAKGAIPAVRMNEAEWRQAWRAEADGFTDVGSLTLSASNGDVTLSGARGRIQGAAFIQSGSDTVTLTAVPGGQQRIDVAVLRYDPTNNTISPQIVTGTPAVSNPQRPLLEPQRSGGSLLTGKYDLPFATFSGAAGTASQRGTDIRSRIVRAYFLRNATDSFGVVNERHGDVRFMEDGSFWFDSTAGSSGLWKRIVDSPPEVSSSTSAIQGGLGTSYQAGATACQVTFVASDSGAVQVEFGGYVVTTSPGVRTTLSVQVRQGASEVLAPHADYSVAAGEVVVTGQECVVSGSNWVDVTGLTPGVTYTARTMAHCSLSSGGRIESRRIRVRHIPPTATD